ncbi:hypothetical protein [Pseudoalteromonas prydzensis]|uniref:hypothetical protein n=1 Tax=Pseudoalteromonas prydzensis TaxID=182141 RepID=UPI0007E4E03E|nr:hypothetical protein [Pseudoalteromonas prydzensis]MBE0380415.1 hypothetical protein [Pseudoalteromonas prydzensis ACAM 620]
MKKLLLSCFILFSYNLSAAPTWHTAKVDRVYPLANGGFVLTFKADNATCKSNSNPKYYYVSEGKNGVTQHAIANFLSVALVAGSSDKELTISFDNESTTCDINRFIHQILTSI